MPLGGRQQAKRTTHKYEKQALLPKRILCACNRYKDLDPDIVKWMLKAAEKYNLDHEDTFNRSSRGRASLDPKHYTKLCTAIVSIAGRPRNDTELQYNLETTIRLRERCRLWYSEHRPHAKTENEGHAYYLGIMRRVRQILFETPINDTADDSFVHSSDDEPERVGLPLHCMTTSFGVSVDESDSDSESSHEDEDGEASESSMSDLSLSSSVDDEEEDEDEEDEEDDDSDVHLAVWEFFEELYELRRYVRASWKSYRLGKIHLVTAAFLSNRAVQAVKEIEQDFQNRFPSEDWEDFGGLVGTLLGSNDQCDHAISIISHARGLESLLMIDTWMAIRTFVYLRDLAKASLGSSQPLLPTIPTNQLSIIRHLIEVSTLLADQTEVRKDCPLASDLLTFVQSGPGTITAHLAFQWQIWSDIVSINRDTIDEPVNFLRGLTTRIMISFDVARWCPKLRSDASTLHPPPKAISRDPWGCGFAAGKLLIEANSAGIEVVNQGRHFSSMMQLYIRLERRLAAQGIKCDVMNQLQIMCEWKKARPRISQTMGHITKACYQGALTDDETAELLSDHSYDVDQTTDRHIRILSAVRARVEIDLATSSLSIDLFTVQRMAIMVMKKVGYFCERLLREVGAHAAASDRNQIYRQEMGFKRAVAAMEQGIDFLEDEGIDLI